MQIPNIIMTLTEIVFFFYRNVLNNSSKGHVLVSEDIYLAEFIIHYSKLFSYMLYIVLLLIKFAIKWYITQSDIICRG
jgi:hypothetical protein